METNDIILPYGKHLYKRGIYLVNQPHKPKQFDFK